MTTYDFTTRPNRFGQHSKKWFASEQDRELLQMWVADMDFLPVPEIRETLRVYAQEHIFGYPQEREELYQAILDWEKNEHGYEVAREAIVLIEAVVPAISVAIQAFTERGDAVLIQTPLYPPFARSVRLNHRQLVVSPLVERNHHLEIDFDQLEKDIIEHDVKLYLLCNPHNPGGRVWTKEELLRIGELCQKHGVLLVADEIHQDLVLFGNKHHSFNTLSPDFKNFAIVLASATKTFNIAGTKNSFAIIENSTLRQKFTTQQLANNQHEIPTVGLLAAEAAYRYGKPWLEELKVVLEKNIDYVFQTLSEKTKIRVMKPEGTYLVWLDFSAYGLTNEEVQEKLVKQAKVVLNDGVTFGPEGNLHARFNAAAPFETVAEACNRIVRVFGK